MLISLTNSPGAAKHAGLFPAPVDAGFGSVYQLDFCLHDSGWRRSLALPLDWHQILSITFDVSYHCWFCYRNLSGPMEMSKKTDPNCAQRPGWIRWQLPSPSVELWVVWVMRSAAERQQPPLARKSSAAAESFSTTPTSIMSQLYRSVHPVKNNLLREICRPAQTQTERWAGSGRVLMDALCELSLVFYHFLMSLTHNLGF